LIAPFFDVYAPQRDAYSGLVRKGLPGNERQSSAICCWQVQAP